MGSSILLLIWIPRTLLGMDLLIEVSVYRNGSTYMLPPCSYGTGTWLNQHGGGYVHPESMKAEKFAAILVGNEEEAGSSFCR
jgi:hypothetical protein